MTIVVRGCFHRGSQREVMTPNENRITSQFQNGVHLRFLDFQNTSQKHQY